MPIFVTPNNRARTQVGGMPIRPRRPWRCLAVVAALGLLGAVSGFSVAGSPQPADIDRDRISTIGSERATSGGGNKIVTYRGRTHVVWQDATKEGYFNRIRTLDHATGTWGATVTLNEGRDNHARPVLTIDHEGFLHAVLSGHNSPVTHRRSVRANDSSAWTPAVAIGKGTYPIIACGPDGSLYVTMRSAKRWNGVDLYVKRPGAPWTRQCKLVKRHETLRGYAAFHGGLAVGKNGVLHCVVDFYESEGVMERRGLHQAVCYLRSRDKGITWEKADGTLVGLPARPADLDILARTIEKERHEPMPPPEVLAQGCIVADPKGVPHVLFISHLDEPGQLLHAWPDAEGRWHRRPIEAAKRPFPEHRPTGCRGALTVDAAGNIHALLELQPLGKGWHEGKPTRGMNWNAKAKRLIWLTRPDGAQEWRARPALPAGTVFNQANVERPTGVNLPAAGRRPPFVYFDGTSRYRKKGEIIQNHVYVVRPAGG